MSSAAELFRSALLSLPGAFFERDEQDMDDKIPAGGVRPRDGSRIPGIQHSEVSTCGPQVYQRGSAFGAFVQRRAAAFAIFLFDLERRRRDKGLQ